MPRASTLTELWMQLCKEHKALAEQGIYEVREQLKAERTETRTYNLPDGLRTFSAGTPSIALWMEHGCPLLATSASPPAPRSNMPFRGL